ncbi:flavodoxin family protein [uncultured Bifidobacterium sp.]|uniref:flavodoxin family protein n=1 Tax=uncultured Bifidobacterium sp. TaxID=165187 RepID=UPI00258EAE4D|nr:flavodoxin family protein [uncultured Bifidobacterium sp.]
MTHIVAYIGSRNPHSQTVRAVKQTKAALDRILPATWSILTPLDMTILPSDGTADEFYTGVDHIAESGDDDSSALKQLIETCDYLILGTPTYGHNVSGDMKILMDRLTYWAHLIRLSNKPGMAFVSATTNGFLEVGALMEQFMESLGVVIGETAYHTTAAPFDEAAAQNVAHRIAEVIANLHTQPVLTPSERQEQMFRAYRRMYRRRDEGDCEARYWRERGMLDCDTLQEYFAQVARQER